MSEFSFIERVRAELAAVQDESRLSIPIGDDAAEVRIAGGKILLATDLLLDGTHFEIGACGGELAGRKSLAVNLSDLAAMAATPVAAVVSLALPKSGGEGLGLAVMKGIGALAAAHGVAIAGGDTNVWRQDGRLAINVAIIGEAHPLGSVTRGGAQVGDAIFVTGALGGSIFGRHLTFSPQVALATELHSRFRLNAMIDISDGLAGDLRHILRASGVAAALDPALLPIHADVEQHRLPIDAMTRAAAAREHCLADGEDFELCFTLPEAGAKELEAAFFGRRDAPIRIGKIVRAPIGGDTNLRWTSGESITARGFEHDWR